MSLCVGQVAFVHLVSDNGCHPEVVAKKVGNKRVPPGQVPMWRM
jgi:hypothetical protein